MSNPQNKWQTVPGENFLELIRTGDPAAVNPVGGIDSTGAPFGNLLPGVHTDATLSGAGTPASPLSVAGAALISPVVSPNPLAFDTNVNFKGPNPYVDVTRYGVRAITPTTTPAAVGLTVTINSGSASALISSASSFVNGDGVVIYGAGPAHSMTTPTGVSVTPSIASAGTGTGLVVNGPAGSTTYNYQVIARDKNGGLTAASTVASTTTGSASLGRQSVNISTLSRSGNITTVVTSSAHSLSIGSMVYVATTSDDVNFGGWFVVATTPDNTHFTFLSGLDTNNGAATSATGGTAVWFNCNHITWTAVTGAFQYHIYGRTGGSLTWIGCSRPTGNNLSDLTFDDFGSPMMDNFKQPGLIPSTPPSSATSDSLVTTILSGAGTTSLTLANTASTNVSGATIRFDNAPNILTAANAARNVNGLLHFPVSSAGQYVVNSYLVLPSDITISITTGFFLNDTIEAGQGVNWYGDVIPQGRPPQAFAQNSWAQVGVSEANPGIYIPSGTISYWRGLSFSGQGLLNGGLLVVADQVSPITFENVNFTSSTGSGDYMGIGLILRGDVVGSGNSSYVNIFRNVFIGGGPTQVNGACFTPGFYCDGCGLTSMVNINLTLRGIFVRSVLSGPSSFELNTGRQQGSIMPTVTFYSGFGDSPSIIIRSFEQDTTAHPIFTALGGATPLVLLENSGFPGGVGGATAPLVCGLMASTVGVNEVSGNSTAITGQNTLSKTLNFGFAIDGAINTPVSGRYTSQIFNTGVTIGKAYSLFAAGPAPAAPTAVVSAGGGVSIGTHTYQVVPVWANGAEGAVSPPSALVTTTTGNQTVTVSWVAVPGGPIGYDVYQDGQLVSLGAGNCTTIPQYTGTSAVITSFICGSGTSVPAGGPTILNVNGLFAPALTLSSVLFANLGTPKNGTFYFCPDCNIANPCTGSGTGAFAKRLNGVWVCN
jgi:hypothetical protein